MIKILIDSRENAIKEKYDTIKLPLVEFKQLDLGDIQLYNDDKLLLIIERKTISDLYQSIKDGRYHEQKKRLTSNIARCNILYIIEGTIEKTKYIDIHSIYGAIQHMIYRDKINVYRTLNLLETLEWIYELYDRIVKNPEQWDIYMNENSNIIIPNDKILDPIIYSKGKKSDNITSSIAYKNMLNQVPGCSSQTSEAISIIYPNMMYLCNAYNNLEDICLREKLLLNIKIKNKDKERKVGPVMSKKIYNYMYGNNIDK
jgi:crossover junction endonuclease MUS81